MIKFSIVIPVYNAEKTLPITLESCLNQTYSNIEIICIDDCSSDTSPDILKHYAEKDVRIRYINLKKNVNSYMARKAGIKYITGDYILFLDSDDTLVINACKFLLKEIGRNPVDMIEFGYKKIPQNSTNYPAIIKSPSEYLLKLCAVYPGVPSAVWTRAYKKEVLIEAFNNMNDFYAFMAEDVYTSVVILYYTKTLSVLRKVLINYTTSGKSTSNIFDLHIYNNWLESYNTIIHQLQLFFKQHHSEILPDCQAISIHLLNDFIDKIPKKLTEEEKLQLSDSFFSIINKQIAFAYIHHSGINSIKLYNSIYAQKTRIQKIFFAIKLLIKSIIGLPLFENEL
jgi:glycosyltransferase involved in cell wall biosynthesis